MLMFCPLGIEGMADPLEASYPTCFGTPNFVTQGQTVWAQVVVGVPKDFADWGPAPWIEMGRD